MIIEKTDPISIDESFAKSDDGVLLGYQKDWVLDRASVKVGEKGRQIGLTWTEAGDDALLAAREDGMDVFYISYNKDMTRTFIDDCATWAKFYNLACSEVEEFIFKDHTLEGDKDIQAYRIRFDSGFEIVALSSKPSSIRSKRGKLVIDEAGFVEDLGGLIKAAMAFLIWGGKVVIISTHNGAENPFNILIEDIRAGKLPYSLHRTTFDDAIADGLYKRVCLKLKKEWTPEGEKAWRDYIIKSGGENSDEEFLCIPSQGGGVFMSRVLVESCMKDELKVIRIGFDDAFVHRPALERESEVEAICEDSFDALLAKLDPKRAHYFGEDFGRSGDLTCLWPGAEKQDLGIRVPFVVELRNCPFEQQRQIVFHILDRLPNFRHGCFDGRGNGQYLSEVAMQRYSEFRITQVMISSDWYRDVMPKYKAAYEDKNIEIPRDADILEDHRALKMEKGIARIPDERTTGADKGKRHGDSAIAGAMLWMATRTEGPAPAAVGQEPTKDDYRVERAAKSGARSSELGAREQRPGLMSEIRRLMRR
jgi:phage FluMu gp28-like protein